MKATKLNILSKNIFLIIATAMMIFSISSCATKATFLSSSVVPAAQGFVKVKKDKNNNYNLDIQIINLAESTKLQPPKETYVIWMESEDNYVKNIGQINSSTNFLSKKLKASFTTVSSVKPTRVYITAEDDASIQYSGKEVVLSTSDF